MDASEIITTMLVMFAGIMAGGGYAAASVTPADYRKARVCFWIGATCAGLTIIVWGFSSVQPLWARLFVLAIFGAGIFVALNEGLRWVGGREHGPEATSTEVAPQKIEKQPSATKISELPVSSDGFFLRLQFKGGQQAPVEVRSENVLQWYVIWTGEQKFSVGISGVNGSEKEFVAQKQWNIFVMFDKPTKMRQLILDAGSSNFPHYEVKFVSTTSAIIITYGDDPPAGIVDIYSKD